MLNKFAIKFREKTINDRMRGVEADGWRLKAAVTLKNLWVVQNVDFLLLVILLDN